MAAMRQRGGGEKGCEPSPNTYSPHYPHYEGRDYSTNDYINLDEPTKMSPINLHGLLEKNPDNNVSQLRKAFMADPKYDSWRQLYYKACENVEIRIRETPISLVSCPADKKRVTNFPVYPGIAKCCIEHHVAHIKASLELSINVCEMEMQASVTYLEWLALQPPSSEGCQADVDCTEAYIVTIRHRLFNIKVAQLACGGIQDKMVCITDEICLERVVGELPRNVVGPILTPFPVKKAMNQRELNVEQARVNQLSRNDVELEKVHPERIEFLRFMYDTYKTGANDQATKLEHEASQQEVQTGDDESPEQLERPSRREYLMSIVQGSPPGPTLQTVCDLRGVPRQADESMNSLADSHLPDGIKVTAAISRRRLAARRPDRMLFEPELSLRSHMRGELRHESDMQNTETSATDRGDLAPTFRAFHDEEEAAN